MPNNSVAKLEQIPSNPTPLPNDLRRVVAAATVGTALEWYDFFLYGVIAPLVFDSLYFPKLDPAVGLIVVWGTFGAGFWHNRWVASSSVISAIAWDANGRCSGPLR